MAVKVDHETYISEELNPSAGFWIKVKKCVATVNSPYQKIELFETEPYGLALRIDDYWMTSEKDEFYYHENMVHPAAVALEKPRSALIIGGGDGGAAEEYLKYNSMKRVVLAELDEEVVNFCKEHLSVIHKGAFDDPRLELRIGDGKSFVENTNERFDLMMLDLTDPFGPAESLYGVEFLDQCKRVLGEHGVLSMHIGSPVMKPKVFGRIVASLKKVFPVVRPMLVYVPLYGTLWGMATASLRTDPLMLSKHDIDSVIKARNLKDLQFYNSSTHFGTLSLPNFVISICNDDSFKPISISEPLNEFGLDPTEHAPVRVVMNDGSSK